MMYRPSPRGAAVSIEENYIGVLRARQRQSLLAARRRDYVKPFVAKAAFQQREQLAIVVHEKDPGHSDSAEARVKHFPKAISHQI